MTRVSLAGRPPRPTTRVRTAVGSPDVALALSRLSASALLVDLDLAVRRPGAAARLHARHGLHDGLVTAVSSALTDEVEIATFDVAHWQSELARSVLVAPGGSPPPAPAPGLELPWDLLIGTAAARTRPELYDVLLTRAVGSVRAGSVVLDGAACREQVRRVHDSVLGRLRAVGLCVTRDGRRRAGWVGWLLFADGWRALTPCSGPRDVPRATVRLEPRIPGDLGVDVARWAVGVAS